MTFRNSILFFLVIPVSLMAGQPRVVRPQKAVKSVVPMITVNWDQGCYYNEKCPPDTSSAAPCYHTLAGSGAVAMAQIMKYYNFPPHGFNSHSYILPGYGTLYVNFDATTYNWLNMPPTLTSSNDAV